MSKCNLETECKGSGKCCLECTNIYGCQSKCKLINEDRSIKDNKKEVMENCDWYEK